MWEMLPWSTKLVRWAMPMRPISLRISVLPFQALP